MLTDSQKLTASQKLKLRQKLTASQKMTNRQNPREGPLSGGPLMGCKRDTQKCVPLVGGSHPLKVANANSSVWQKKLPVGNTWKIVFFWVFVELLGAVIDACSWLGRY